MDHIPEHRESRRIPVPARESRAGARPSSRRLCYSLRLPQTGTYMRGAAAAIKQYASNPYQ